MPDDTTRAGGLGGAASDIPAAPETADSTGADADELEAAEAVHYYFPVEIEVRNESAEVDRDAIIAEALRRLTEGIRSA